MPASSFLISMILCGFTVLLLGWQGYQDASASWVPGFLAVVWSMVLMLRILILTEPVRVVAPSSLLAQKITNAFRLKQEENRKSLLENSFGGSYVLFLFALVFFAMWQIFCAAFPSNEAALDGVRALTESFFSTRGQDFSWPLLRAYEWGEVFLAFLCLAIMGFVLRSVSLDRRLTAPAMLVLSSYAIAGYIFFAGLAAQTKGAFPFTPQWIGNGAGSAAYFEGALPENKAMTLFDLVLIESGIGGLAILSFIVFIPLGYLALAASNRHCDKTVCYGALLTGCAMILAFFLPFTPIMVGYFAMCWMAVFLGWGHAENAAPARKPLTQ